MKKNKTIFYLIFTLIFFSSFELVSKMINIDAFILTGLRFFLGGLFIFLFNPGNIILEYSKLSKNLKFKVIISGFINVCMAMLLLQISVKLGNASTSAIIISSNPLFVFIFLAIKDFRERNKFAINHIFKLLILLVGIIGIFIIMYKPDKGDSLLAITLAIIASISFAYYTIYSQKLLKNVSPLTLNSISFSVNGLILFVGSLIFSSKSIGEIFINFDIMQLILLIILSFGITGLAYITYFKALMSIDAGTASLVFYLKPVIATSLNYFILHETIGLPKIIGIILILLTLFLYNSLKSKVRGNTNKIY